MQHGGIAASVYRSVQLALRAVARIGAQQLAAADRGLRPRPVRERGAWRLPGRPSHGSRLRAEQMRSWIVLGGRPERPSLERAGA